LPGPAVIDWHQGSASDRNRPGDSDSSLPFDTVAVVVQVLHPNQITLTHCWTSIPFLGSIAKPTLIVNGDRDRLVPPANGRILAERIRGATAVTVRSGHDLQHPERAAELASLVGAFLDAQN
jgi:pimeloyl-ACP methyl ester carboxylesterase